MEPDELSARARRRFYLRRYAGKLLYELDLHDGEGGLAAHAPGYARGLSVATGVAWPREAYLEDVDPAFYVTCYLRAWALEARLRGALQERFGEDWGQPPPQASGWAPSGGAARAPTPTSWPTSSTAPARCASTPRSSVSR